ncbi:fibrinogen alpha chain isoform X2 [Etheostoma spectabile]|uniref:fibrinogen alpha chain isoform X2 n=1 Tax=Etheostoma spectabile TaxID=54343 RepID=UPI0013AF9C54|nr:fibrinogen alpha chain isoform X2 [Etheostoma spectabile]
MERLNVLVCLGLVCAASALAQVVDPRGARPVEQGTRSETCATERDWPFCSDDDWGAKCPSGCRILGLINKFDHGAMKRIEKIRGLLDLNKAKHRSADQVSKQTYDYLKDKLTVDSDNDNSYYNLAQTLRQRITDMKIKIDRQLRILGALKDRVKDQVVDMQRLEVDIDIKLRSCKGSCQSYTVHQLDRESYVELEKQVGQLDALSAQSIESVGTLSVMKSRPLQGVIVDSVFKSKDVGGGQQRENMFPEVRTVQLVLEQEGSSSSSPATISKVPGTSFTPSTSSSSSSSTTTSSKSITELGGRGGGGDDVFGTGLGTSHVGTRTVSCTRSTRRTVVHTKNGPVEKVEEVFEGGPECSAMTDLTKGGMGALFPSLGHTSSSSSSSSSSSVTKTVHAGGAKGSLLDTKTDFGNPFGADTGLDMGLFDTGAAEDDLPDIHARSVKSVVTERRADYVGKDCVEAHQNHLNGESNGLFKIRPGGAASASAPVLVVYCQQAGLMGGWLLAQQRESGALGFNRTWAEYRDGFGSVDAAGRGEFWLGNRNLHLLTGQGESMLRVELEDWEGGVAGAEYAVRVGAEADGFPLHVSGYTGDAGDALAPSHDGMRFSTFDRDSDLWGGSCAGRHGGGWWYNRCQTANLNGVYHKGAKNQPHEAENGVVWATYKPANYSLKAARMFIRPAAF